VISIEGNIGCGKSTVIDSLRNYPDIETVFEPVDKWKNCNEINILELFYKDPKKNSALFQSYIALTFLEEHNKDFLQPFRVMERSFVSAVPFIEVLKTSKEMDSGELAVLQEWRNYLMKDLRLQDHVIYLRTDPQISCLRVNKRARTEEDSIPLTYLTDVHNAHDKFLFDIRNTSDVTCINANESAEIVLNQVMEKINEIKERYSPCRLAIDDEDSTNSSQEKHQE